MLNGHDFPDYYQLLQVNPDCDARILEIAYHHFAKRYHPDNAETADSAKFTEVVEAYKLLRDPEKRAEYDKDYSDHHGKAAFRFPAPEDLSVDEKDALNDALVHERLLLHLYKRRREHAADAGVTAWMLQEMVGCSDDRFEFHAWYLKARGLIAITEQGTWEITIQGVDQVIASSRTNTAEKLLLARGAPAAN